ncbi:biotin/lipoyl-containing protein [Pedobacter insulae]|uniref:Biotin-requiring enzyme n=1 Tax=Pedobacter insulae TaxID=414048 RepID=A0A1I2T3M6_9SPHI|nr:acetyl-CoA carboxylase biotin carboxyl carrier protein subunit [Pedobacter insulae]SFG59450.1 Biotin-requiring enzyme [Pedobacter insulae]
MYNVKVNEQYGFAIKADHSTILVNDEPVIMDSIDLGVKSKHIIYQNRSYTIEIVAFDKTEKTAAVKVNGTIYKVEIEDEFDQLLKQLGMDSLAVNKVQQIKAPMPGLVLNVLVSEGDEVKKGDNLLVLEAMKMENMIKSPTDGLIKKIAIKQGDKVEKNQVLINF